MRHLFFATFMIIYGLIIAKIPQTVDFKYISDRFCSDPVLVVNATVPSGLPVTIEVVFGPAFVTNNVVTLTDTGVVRLSAFQIGNSEYERSPTGFRNFKVRSHYFEKLNNRPPLVYPENVCLGDTLTLTPIHIEGIKFRFFDESTSTEIEGTVSLSGTALGKKFEYTMIVQDNFCTVSEYDIKVTTIPKPMISIPRIPGTIFTDEIPFELQPSPPFGAIFLNGSLQGPMLTSTTTGIYTLRYDYRTQACHVDTSFTFYIATKPVVVDPFIYNVVTPNGDGKNDFLYIENIEGLNENKLMVFDHWGNNLHTFVGYANTWQPSDLEVGNYYYVFQTENPKNTHKGSFLIK